MINVDGNRWIPSDGYKYLSNGNIWTDSIAIGRNDNIENWHDTNDEPPDPEEHKEATTEDFAEALAELGVRL